MEPVMPSWKNYPKKGIRIGRRTVPTFGTTPAPGAASASEDAFSITVNARNEGENRAMQAEETQEEGITQSRELTDDQRAIDPTELSDHHQRAFQSEMTLYNANLAAYKEETKSHRELKAWVIKTVDPEYTEHTCPPEETVRDWYAKLKTRLGVTDITLERNARENYKAALKARKGRDVKAWIENWEKQLANARLQAVPEALKPTAWFDDLRVAVKDIPWLNQWLAQYEIGNKRDIQNGILDYREVANDMVDQSRHYEQTSRVQKGAGRVWTDFCG
jgi:prophage antirepressor-like protein